MILNEKYMKHIRAQARMGDDTDDKRFQCLKYGQALRMLADAWRLAWPDCLLKVTQFRKGDDLYRANIFIDVELSVFGNPGSLLDQFRASFTFGDSDDLIINFGQSAQGLVDNFYDWQQEWVRGSLKRS